METKDKSAEQKIVRAVDALSGWLKSPEAARALATAISEISRSRDELAEARRLDSETLDRPVTL